MDLSQLKIRPLTREEFDVAVEWAAAEGWNPGLHDTEDELRTLRNAEK